jgi:hypothetical protein
MLSGANVSEYIGLKLVSGLNLPSQIASGFNVNDTTYSICSV